MLNYIAGRPPSARRLLRQVIAHPRSCLEVIRQGACTQACRSRADLRAYSQSGKLAFVLPLHSCIAFYRQGMPKAAARSSQTRRRSINCASVGGSFPGHMSLAVRAIAICALRVGSSACCLPEQHHNLSFRLITSMVSPSLNVHSLVQCKRLMPERLASESWNGQRAHIEPNGLSAVGIRSPITNGPHLDDTPGCSISRCAGSA